MTKVKSVAHPKFSAVRLFMLCLNRRFFMKFCFLDSLLRAILCHSISVVNVLCSCDILQGIQDHSIESFPDQYHG